MEQSVPLVALVGNPNSGKSTLFNALTGLRQKIGNYPGVTVEWKEGTTYTQHGRAIRLLDLPGTYSLNARSPDEQIVVDVLLGQIPKLGMVDGVICCVDASNLERNLFLASQVLELGIPALVVLTMMDVALRRGMRVDVDALSERLGVEVLPCEVLKGRGLAELRIALARPLRVGDTGLGLPRLLTEAAADLEPLLAGFANLTVERRRGLARRLVMAEGEGDLHGPERTRVKLWQQRFDREVPGWRSEYITTRYAWIGEVMRVALRRYHPGQPSVTERVDRYLLHPVFGFLVLGCVMASLFYSIFALAVPFMDALDGAFGWMADRLGGALPAGPLRDLLVEGVLGGVGGVAIFLPQILLLFFFISLLESTGYMARAAFILDRLMSKVGLHGRSFIPLLSSYACAVPGIMATRTIESPKDRLITILVAPLMTCSARLPVYLVLIAALFAGGSGGPAGAALAKALVLMGLYIGGTVAALFFAWVFRNTLLRGAQATMVMELPAYRLPQWRSVLMEMIERGWIFIKRAGTVIFAFSVLLWFLLNYPQTPPSEVVAAGTVAVAAVATEAVATSEQVDGDLGGQDEPERLAHSFAARMGRALEPLFAPLGYDWSITLGIIASFAAREVFISTMAIVYRVNSEEADSLAEGFRAALREDGTLLFTPLVCLSILVFFVFALQCISTVAVVWRETRSWRWPLFQFVWMFVLAWGAAFIVYQGGRVLGFQ